MPPKPYQLAGIDFLHDRTRALLADDAGLGKSMQMIFAANQLALPRVLILAPALARGSWKLQLQEWDDRARPVHVWPKPPGVKNRFDLPTGPCAVIVSLEYLSRSEAATALRDAMSRAGTFDVAFVDEAHGLKSSSAARTRNVYGRKLDLKGGILEKTPRRWLATATPTPLGHVGELYSHLRALFPDVLLELFDGKIPNEFGFQDRFCNVYETRFGREILGNNEHTIPDLRAALAPFIIMRRKADVLTDLPPILTVPLPLDTGFKAETLDAPTDEELAAMSDEEVNAYLARLDTADTPARMQLGEAKLLAVLPWIAEFLTTDPTRKLLVFAHHRKIVEGLRGGLAAFNPAMIYGGTTPAQKESEVARFQADPSCRVFVGQNIAAGTAITLTAAHTVLLLEPHPSPDQNYQIISRAHRLGQTQSVTAMIAYDANVPLERRQAQILRRRAADNEIFLGVKTPGVMEAN